MTRFALFLLLTLAALGCHPRSPSPGAPLAVTASGALGNRFVHADKTTPVIARILLEARPSSRAARPQVNLALVIDTVGFAASFWMNRLGLPHTEQLHTIERFTRTAFDTLRYELTIDDPGAYTAPFSGQMNLQWEAGTELFEYVCQEENYAPTLMVGQEKKVDRTSLIVP